MFGNHIFAYELLKEEIERRQQDASRIRAFRNSPSPVDRKVTMKLGRVKVTITKEPAHAASAM